MRSSLSIGPWRASKYDNSLPEHQKPNENGEWFTAKVPGAIQYDLMAQGKLENPYASTQSASAAAWVAKSDWLYQAEFDSPSAVASASRILLRLEGIDTFSEVWLNGNFLGETANAYRSYELPVKSEFLVPRGEKSAEKNKLLIRIKAHERMIANKMDYAERLGINPAAQSAEGLLGKALIRRYQRSFFLGAGSLLNMGTGVLGIGIIRKVNLIWYPGAYLRDCAFRTVSISDNKAEAQVLVNLENASTATKLKIRIDDTEGCNVFTTEITGVSGEKEIPVSISNPKLWWPRGYGEPYLYTLKAEVEEQGEIIDEITQRIGIRSSELIRRDNLGRKTFYLKINGRKIMVHGTNTIPLDYIKSYGSREEYDRIFALMDNQYINLVRIWGGGMIEAPFFYEACDERGIIMFHELFLHSMVYPDWDEAFVKEFMTESEGILKQLRGHPCLCLVSGGNEQEQGWDEWGWKTTMDRFYGEKLIKEFLPVLCAKLCPELPYITNSPHGGKDANSPVEGDAHSGIDYYNSFKDPTFVTETSWAPDSYSRPETLKKYMDLDVDAFKGIDWVKKWTELTHLPLIRSFTYTDWFKVMSLREYLHSRELEQMRAYWHALSNFRFNSPSNNGIVYWALNKGAPLFQFGCVDYGGYPMMPYYAVKRVFAPLAVKVFRDMSDITVVASNHAAEKEIFTVEAHYLNKSGTVLGNWKWEAKFESGETGRIARLEGLYDKVHDRTGELIYTCILKDGVMLADDMLFFCTYLEFDGIYKPLKIKIEKLATDKWRLNISAETPVRLVELESNHKLLFSDNYFSMIPGREKFVDVSLLERTSSEPVQLKADILGSGEVQTFVFD